MLVLAKQNPGSDITFNSCVTNSPDFVFPNSHFGGWDGGGETGVQGDHFMQCSLVCSSDISPWVDLGSGFWQEDHRSVEIFSVLMMPIYPMFLFLASELGGRQRLKTRM